MAIIIGGGGVISDWDYEGYMTVGYDSGNGWTGWMENTFGSITPAVTAVTGFPHIANMIVWWPGDDSFMVSWWMYKACNEAYIDGLVFSGFDNDGVVKGADFDSMPLVGETVLVKLR